ncbi:MAG: DUF4159 domain-containing protein [Acetobacter sp.]|jgi:hypothetical protein|nr:DUF4159 domain-containing protein [Acetobacter sp.]MCH4059906.1 DUF4159 domain-containing protein [Acetobacter sp.]MCH4086847.1 DUF4159 domain-containing protein [Acetobacter sp.]MCI1294333.1 DUF4159 domain-containing protein [Acetobacter sp.]MCI1320983.1 DUF4159 domain-containing protein [Acetobacter sp.]
MTFIHPALLAGLCVLPAIWWLLRLRPPVPRTQIFPPVALLDRLHSRQTVSASPPFWLFILRLAAIICLITGLADPTTIGTPLLPSGRGPLLLVLDNGMMSAATWNQRIATTDRLLDEAARGNRKIFMLLTAPDGPQENISPLVAESASSVRQQIDASRPAPWPADRAAAAKKLATLPTDRTISAIWISDGIAATGDQSFADALLRTGSVQEILIHSPEPVLLSPSATPENSTIARLRVLPSDQTRHFNIRARNLNGGTLAVTTVAIEAGKTESPITIDVPPALHNQIDTLTVDGQSSVPSTFLLDESDRLRPVGLIVTGGGDTPLIGSQFYLRRALSASADLRIGNAATLLAQPLSVLIAPDGTLSNAALRQKILAWVKAGGTLIRFAGPTLAAQSESPGSSTSPDDDALQEGGQSSDPLQNLLPVLLMPGSRQLGGTMSWGKPQPLAAFPAESPFHGLTVPKDVTVSRQILARPSAELSQHTWARLEDGTPLVTHQSLGRGEIVLFHITATADWSNLPLSGLFLSMLNRLTDYASGVSVPLDDMLLAPALTLDGDGISGPPPPFARAIAANKLNSTKISPQHPAGLYGPRNARRALNAGTDYGVFSAAQTIGTVTDTSGRQPDRHYGLPLVVMALIFLMLDQCAGLMLRSPRAWFRRKKSANAAWLVPLLIVMSPLSLQAAETTPPATTAKAPAAALGIRLAYIITGDEETDAVSREGLQGLSDYVNARTSAILEPPDGVHPDKDDLAFYPLLYWPIRADARVTPAITAALSSFMAHGGMLLIDTQGLDPKRSSTADQGNDEAAGTAAALRRVTAGLPIPPLAHLDEQHVLSRTFYLLRDYPGRYAGHPVWVAREGQAENDDVSPVIIGSADWAHAWAVDSQGDTRFAVFPGDEEQRQMAYRFGLNTVIYALTGNYKGDQVHVPEILKRMGQ